MKKRSLLAKRMDQFYEEIQTKRDSEEQMMIQKDLEFRQREIQKLNQKYNIFMFHTKTRGGKAFAAKQKIREFEKILQKSKRMHKFTSTKRIEPKKLIPREANNLNSIASQKYGVLPNLLKKIRNKMKVFMKFMIFIGQLKFKNIPKDTNLKTSDKTIKSMKN